MQNDTSFIQQMRDDDITAFDTDEIAEDILVKVRQ